MGSCREISEADAAGLVASARAAHPGIALDEVAFLRHIADRLEDDVPLTEALDGLAAGDLWLACACLAGCPHAARIIRDAIEPPMRAALTRVVQGADLEEALQRALTKILVGDGQPALARYRGHGSLVAWARVIAVREAHDEHRRRARAPIDEAAELVDRAVVVQADAELLGLKRAYREAFRRAFSFALATLSERDRSVLRHCYLEGLSIDEVGILLGAHRATVARWREHARTRLFEATRLAFRTDLELESADLDSAMRIIDSQISVSLSGLREDRRGG